MTLNQVRESLTEHIGKKVVINCNIGRNKIETYNVTLKEMYDNIFLVQMNTDSKEIKSFSYNDIITKNIKINY